MGWKKADVQSSIEGRNDVRLGPPYVRLESGPGGKPKKTWFRLLPPREDHDSNRFYKWVRIHFGVGGNNRTVACPQFDDRYCPVCAEVRSLEQNGFEREARDLSARTRALMNVLELDAEGNVVDNEVKVFAAPKEVINKLLDALDELDPHTRDITDPDTGRFFWVKKRGKKVTEVEYEVGVHETPSAMEEEWLGFLDDMHDLVHVYPTVTSEALAGLLSAGHGDPFAALPAGAVEGEVRELTPTTNGSRPRFPTDDDDEPTPAPAAPRARASAPAPATPSSDGPPTRSRPRASAPAAAPAPAAAASDGPPTRSRAGTRTTAAANEAEAARARLREQLAAEAFAEEEGEGDAED